MKKSELKEIIKSAMLEEAEDSKKGNKEEQKRMEGSIRDDRDHIKNLEKDIKDNEDKLAKLKKDEPKDISEEMKDDKMEEGDNYYEDSMDEAKEEVFTDVELDMASEMLMDMFDKLGLENNVEKSDALVKYINAWFETNDFVNEAEDVEVEDNEEVDVDIEKDVKIDDESVESDIEVDASMPGESADEVAVQSLLMKAQEEAAKLGDEKLTDQIGNTITYFTRAHVSQVDETENYNSDDVDISIDNPAEDAGIGFALQEVKRFKKLAGIIK